MTNALRSVVGLVTIGQSPRSDVVPEMAALIGPGIEVREAGALDGLKRSEIEPLAPTGDDEILVTRPQDGSAVFGDVIRAGGPGPVVRACMGCRGKARDELRGLAGVAVLLANLLVARVIAEACGA